MFALVSLLLTAAPAQLTIEVKPPDAVIFVDGKKSGDASAPRVVKLSAGKHELKIVHKGDSHTEEVVLKAGEKQTWKWQFEDEVKATDPAVP